MATKIYSNGTAQATVNANEKIAIYSESPLKLYKQVGYPNAPSTWSLVYTTAAGEQYVSAVLSASVATVVRVDAGPSAGFYNTGAAPTVTTPQADITGADATFTVTGLSDTQGGYVKLVGGTSSTAANAGGEAGLLGGQGGSTGAGGPATMTGAVGATTATGTGGAGGATTSTSGAGGAASGNGTGGAGGAQTSVGGAGGAAAGTGAAIGGVGGVCSNTAGAGGAAAGTSAAGAGGAASLVSGAGGAKTGTGTANGGAGGALSITGGAGGATAATSPGTGGAGASIAIAAGAGGAASAGTANGGAGGTISITAGAAGSSAGGTAGLAGMIYHRSPVSRKVTVGTMTDTATISMANILAGTIKCTPTAAATYTMPTGAVIAAALPADFTTGDSLDFCLVNVATNSSYAITVATAASGTTMYGNLNVAANNAVTTISSGIYRIVCSGASTYDVYRVS